MTRGRRTTLIAFGVAYLILTGLWFWATTTNQLIYSSKFDESMAKFGEFFAIVAAPLWFFATMTRASEFRARVIALSVGIVVLAPLPLFFGVSPL